MLGYYLYTSLFGYIVGNVVGLIKHVFTKYEEPLWVSKTQASYSDKSTIRFMLLWSTSAIGLGAFISYLAQRDGDSIVILPIFFFVTGLMLLMSAIPLLEKAYVFADRIEFRVGFQTTFTLAVENISYVLRDKTSGTYAHVLYYDPTYGYSGIGGRYARYRMWIPATLFSKGKIHISPNKLDKNMLETGIVASQSLPVQPLLQSKAVMPWYIKTLIVSILFINPYTALLGAGFAWGLAINVPFGILLFDISNMYVRFIYTQFVRPTTTLDSSYIETHHA